MASTLLCLGVVTSRSSTFNPEAILDWIRPFARHGMVEWTREDSLLHALGETLETLDPGDDDADLSRALLEAGVEQPSPDGDPVPVLLLREPHAWGSPDRSIAAASRRLTEGGLLLIVLDESRDLERRTAEVLAALGSRSDLQIRTRPRDRGDRWFIAKRSDGRPHLALFPDGLGACLQIRTLGPLENLESRGLLELAVLPADADARWLADRDLLILQRFGGLPAARLLLAARRLGVPVALELDDDFFNLPWYNPGAKAFRKFENRALLSALLSGADTVVTSTPYLGQRMRDFNDAVLTMHNLVDTTLFRKIRSPFHEPGVTTFGYIGTKTHSEDLRPVLGPLRDLIRQSRGAVRAVFIGHVPDELSRLPGVRYLGWFGTYQNAALALARSGANVALAPLADVEFNRSKSAMKYLEYGACGIPGIFSDVEAYQGYIRHDENGVLVVEHTPDAWAAAMRAMVDHPEDRKRMAIAAHRDVLHNHSIERRADDFLALYRGITQSAQGGLRDTGARPLTVPAQTAPISVVLNLFGDAEESLPAIAAIEEGFPEGTQMVVVAEHEELSDLLQLGNIVDLVPRQKDGDERNGMARALELARGDWVLCLDHGCCLPTDLLERLEPLTTPDIGALGMRTDSPISAQDIGRILGRDSRFGSEELRAFARETPTTPAPWLEPGCVLLKRQALIEAGGIDPLLTWGDALIDACVRLRAKGHKVLVANGVLVASTTRHRSPIASSKRRSESRVRLARRLADKDQTVVTEPGCDPSPVYGLSGERLDVWVWARSGGRYLDECLRRIESLSDLPLTLNVMHAEDDSLAIRAIRPTSAVSHMLASREGHPLLGAAVATPKSTHAVLLHDGVMVTPGWLREMLTVMVARSASVVVPFANDGSPEQRLVVDRALSLDTLDDMTRSRFATSSDTARPIRQAAAFCVLLDLERLRRGGRGVGQDLSALTRPPEASGMQLAARAYVHVMSHPDSAAEMQMGAWSGGPFDFDLPVIPETAGTPLSDTAFLRRVRPLLSALRENPGSATILAGLGRLYLHQGEVHNAMPFLERARRMDPFSPGVRDSISAARKALDGARATP